jgi:hypothetical protein
MCDLYLPVTPKMARDWANLALFRAGSDQRVSKMWAYLFEKKLPAHL